MIIFCLILEVIQTASSNDNHEFNIDRQIESADINTAISTQTRQVVVRDVLVTQKHTKAKRLSTELNTLV